MEMIPVNLVKFDARVNIAIRGGRVQEIRLGGAVEAPCVNIDVVSEINTCSLISYVTNVANFGLI